MVLYAGNKMINKQNVEYLYDLMLYDEDQTLQGSQWDELYTCDYDTLQSIINDFINIFLNIDFVEFDINTNDFVSISNREEQKEVLAKFFEYKAQELKNSK